MSEDRLKPRYCLSCNYDLRASSDCCPECGRKFDPADHRSFSSYPRQLRFRRWILRITLAVLTIMVILAASIAMLWRGFDSERRAAKSIQPSNYVNARFTQTVLPSPIASILGNRYAYLVKRIGEITIHQHAADHADLSSIEELTYLQKVTLFGGTIESGDIEHLIKLPRLKTLTIVQANALDRCLVPLAGMPSLEEIDLGVNNGMTDSCLDPIGKLPNLQILRLYNIGIIKAEQLKQLRYLNELELTGDEINDGVIEAISGLQQLKTLCLRDTRISRAGLAKLQNLTQLQSLTLEPIFDARWSTELKLLPALKQLDLIYRSKPTAVEENWMRSELPGIHISFRVNESG